MKKIDLHIHTVASEKDATFEFSIDSLREYVKTLSIDAIAITNHNLFDLNQFNEITSEIQDARIFPGIEIDFEKGHLLVISENTALEDFNTKCAKVSFEISNNGYITVEKLQTIFGNLDTYLLIPHFDKSPNVPSAVIDGLGQVIFCGEVSSPKKFHRLKRQDSSITPLLFSDARMHANLEIAKYQAAQTYLKTNADGINLQIIKAAIKDKSKIYLSAVEKDEYFSLFLDGIDLSFGLNVVLGNRSSGKTHFLTALSNTFDRGSGQVKYLKQFSLVEMDEKIFSQMLEKQRGDVRELYLDSFAPVVSDVLKIDRKETLYRIGEYLDSLLEFAESEEIQDEFSKCVLFSESPYPMREGSPLGVLLKAVVTLLENESHKHLIESHLGELHLNALLNELKVLFKDESKGHLQKLWANNALKDISGALHSISASPHIKHNEIDFYEINIEREKIRRFNAIARAVCREKSLRKEPVGSKFTIEASVRPFRNAADLREQSHLQKGQFQQIYNMYSQPVAYLNALTSLNIDVSSIYKLFCKVEYRVLNQFGKLVSGGERSEFNLLRSLSDAMQYEILLVDEPESSFDNLFLKENVNNLIKQLSLVLPVVVVTHNNTVGMLLQPDQIVYASREIVDGSDEYFLYTCSPGEQVFRTPDGVKEVDSFTVLMESLEAGELAYDERKQLYEHYRRRV